MICRLYPNRDQESRMFHYLQTCRQLYNHFLEQRIRLYKETGKSLTKFDQYYDLVLLRSISQVLADVPSAIERDTLDRLNQAYANFFKRIKSGEAKPGFPRFKSANRWNSFSTTTANIQIQKPDRIKIVGITGSIRTRNFQKFQGKIKQQRFVHRNGKWFCHSVIDDGLQPPSIKPIQSSIGLDLGLTSFAVLSTGEQIPNPKFHQKLERKLKRIQRNYCRKTKGGNNRRKALKIHQRNNQRVKDQRWNFTHHLSKRIVNDHQLIAVEKLNIASMMKTRFAKSVMETAWGQFLKQLAYKAESAGCLFVAVDPRGTSQDCSGCGERVQKDITVRVHNCPKCGLQLDRDHNAALNILQRAVSAPAPGVGVSKASGSATEPKRKRKPKPAATLV